MPAPTPWTMAFMGISAGFSMLGSYLSGKQQQAEYKRQAQEMKIKQEMAFINSVVTENNIALAAEELGASNLASSAGGESFYA